MDLTSSSRKREKNMQWSVFFSPHKWRSEDTGDKEQTFNIKLFNLRPRESTEQDIAKPKKELRLGGSHDNLCFTDIFCCIKLSRPLKKKSVTVSGRNYSHSDHESGKNFIHWLSPFLILCESGRWEGIQCILANKPSSALFWNQLVIRMPSFSECPVMAFSGQTLAFSLLTS